MNTSDNTYTDDGNLTWRWGAGDQYRRGHQLIPPPETEQGSLGRTHGQWVLIARQFGCQHAKQRYLTDDIMHKDLH